MRQFIVFHTHSSNVQSVSCTSVCCLQNSHQSFPKIESLHSHLHGSYYIRKHKFGIHSWAHVSSSSAHTHTHQTATHWYRQPGMWNRMRNMKLSIFDQRAVYIRSLKLNGSTFNAYFKRFDRCEMTFIQEPK